AKRSVRASALRAFFDGSTTINRSAFSPATDLITASASAFVPAAAKDAIRIGAIGAGAGIAARGPKIVTHPNAATDTPTISVDNRRSSSREMAMPRNAATTRTGMASAINCVTETRWRTRNHAHGTATAEKAH